jgi:hypothetical protein
MNPFLRSSAGIFVATSSETKTTIAERIITAISKKIAESEHEKVLLPSTWINVVNQIPRQISDSQQSYSADFPKLPTPSQLANKCISSRFCQMSTADLTYGIESLIQTLPTLQSLNCLSISFSKSGDLLISLATLAVNAVNETISMQVDLKETTVNYSNPSVARDINTVFGSFEALSDKPYYVSVKPS